MFSCFQQIKKKKKEKPSGLTSCSFMLCCLQPIGTNYVMLSDDRWLCLECMGSSVMDTYECVDLHLEIREFFEGLFLKVEKEFPLLLVEKQALNKAEEEEKIVSKQHILNFVTSITHSLCLICFHRKQNYHHAVVTRGLCLSEEQIVKSVRRTLLKTFTHTFKRLKLKWNC